LNAPRVEQHGFKKFFIHLYTSLFFIMTA